MDSHTLKVAGGRALQRTAGGRSRVTAPGLCADPLEEGSSRMDLKFMEPQSRWVMQTLFRRDFDTFVESAKRRINWAMLLWDLIVLYLLAQLL